MQAFAQARKSKLQALRKHRQHEKDGEETGELERAVKRNFRNYDPVTGQVRRFGGPRELRDTVENAVKGLQESTIEEDEKKRIEDLDLTNIAPKRPNWDLKRDMQRRLQKLHRRDKEVILILIRQRIQAQQKASGKESNDTSNEAGVTALSAEMAATAAADADLSDDQASEDDEE